MVAIRVRYDGKVLVPDEPLDLPRNQELIVHLDLVSPGPATRPQLGGGGGDTGESVLEWMARNPIDDPTFPPDGAYQHDHYLYGTPKKPDDPSKQ